MPLLVVFVHFFEGGVLPYEIEAVILQGVRSFRLGR